jgi:hypothetical protein
MQGGNKERRRTGRLWLTEKEKLRAVGRERNGNKFSAEYRRDGQLAGFNPPGRRVEFNLEQRDRLGALV